MSDTNPMNPYAAAVTRWGLDETQAAAFLGVPVFTLRKWIKGERNPSAAAVRLFEVLGMLEAIAPAIHAGFLPAPCEPALPRKPGRPKKVRP